MKSANTAMVVPILLIAVGGGWLLSAVGIGPQIDWAWTLGLACVGLLTLVVGGVDKITVVIGPFFILASGLSVLRQTGRLHLDVEISILVIIAGLLALLARMPFVPLPKWSGEAGSPN